LHLTIYLNNRLIRDMQWQPKIIITNFPGNVSISYYLIKFAVMSIDALKVELIQWLASLEDKNFLEAILYYKNIQGKTDWWDKLTENQLFEINKGISDIKEGKTKSSETVWQKYGRKL